MWERKLWDTGRRSRTQAEIERTRSGSSDVGLFWWIVGASLFSLAILVVFVVVECTR